ncbi:MAG: 2-dehydro-3-deoxygalactonokinase [Burkholderiales bacterium]|nr:MAG: 2-dehydro-3-deoxygalactonokinase [Burkholderiales bacterium]
MAISPTHPFIAVDWGTSSFRAALIAPDGEILDELSQPRGILSFKQGEFASYLISTCARMTKAGGQSFVLSGMVGSKDGMAEVPYCACPATVLDVARGVRWAVKDRVAIAPGVRFENEDVMRGEEIQVFGAAAVLGLRDAMMVLPGTHSKWVNLEGGAILGFNTFMTGEIYALLAQHSILSKSLPQHSTVFEPQAFLKGIDVASEGVNILNTAFSVRVKSLFKELAPEHAASYLSGLVIGEELAAMQVQPGVDLILVGTPQLTERYQLALEHLGANVRTLGTQAAWAGLYQIYQALSRI